MPLVVEARYVKLQIHSPDKWSLCMCYVLQKKKKKEKKTSGFSFPTRSRSHQVLFSLFHFMMISFCGRLCVFEGSEVFYGLQGFYFIFRLKGLLLH